jgi:predicted ATPase/DNA-binding winged helix-turn-helix (wHTH) protein/class 3 adenylate cyclase
MPYHFGTYCFDPARYTLTRAGRPVPLRPMGCELLAYLLTHRDRVVLKEELLAQVWPGQYVGDDVLHACILAVRRALHETGRIPTLLHTVRGRGYRFIAPVEVRDLPLLDDAPPALHALPDAALSLASPVLTPPTACETPAALTAVVTPTPVGEYKPVSVLCCGLSDAAVLASRLGPEGLFHLVQTVVALVQEVLQPFEGTLLPPTNESVTVVFGAPVAQEDHARRAVLAALALHQRLRVHPALQAQDAGAALGVRMGVHSGLVVVGGFGQDLERYATVVGAPAQVALRLQQRAAPGTILLSAATYQLVQAEVQVDHGGTLAVDDTPMPVYTVQGRVGRHAGVAGRGLRNPSPFVGRARELARLDDHLAAALAGQGQVVGLVGEPGMGKTRLLAEFCRRVPRDQVTVYAGQCLSYGQRTPYLPVRDLVQQVCGLVEGDTVAVHTAAVQRRLHDSGITAEGDVALLLQLLDFPVAPEVLAQRSPEGRQARTFALLRHLFLAAAQQRPLVLVVENLHWSDSTSAAWLTSLVERLAAAAVLLLGTYRPGYQPAWGAHVAVTQIVVPPLRAQESRTVVQAVLGAMSLSEGHLQAMVARAGGNPFFLEELAWHTREQDPLTAKGVVPDTVHAALAARLDRLPPAVKRLVQSAAVIGMEVPVPLLQAIDEPPEDGLQLGLTHLQAVEFLYETRLVPDLVYTFKHALTQEVAYQSLLTSTRRQVHQRIAQVLEARFPEVAETQPELIAQHYTAAGCAEQAVGYWLRAGEHAGNRSANLEAISHFTTGIGLLTTLPETPAHTQQSLTLHIALGAALQIAKGQAAPEVEQAYSRAYVLCQEVGETPELVPLLLGLWRYHVTRAQLHKAREFGDTLLRLAQRADTAALAVIGNYPLGNTCFYLGAFPAARQHLERAIARSTPDQRRTLVFRMGHDPGVASRAFAAMTLWCLGYPGQALARLHETLAFARALAHPLSLAWAQAAAAMVAQFRRDVSAVHTQAEAAIALSTEQGFPLWMAWGTFLRGWAMAMQGQGEAGLAQIRQGFAAFRATEAVVMIPYLCTLLADVAEHMGHPEDGLQALAEAHTRVEQHEEHWWEAEVNRLRGVLLLRRPGTPQAEAETWLQRALDVARRQEAKSLELRAAMSLSRLWQQQGKQAEARTLLAPIYGWFTEGFDTADLQEAKALLGMKLPRLRRR